MPRSAQFDFCARGRRDGKLLWGLYINDIHSEGLSVPKNMETIYWTCGGVANMVNIIIVGLNLFFLGSHNSQEVTLPRKSQLPCAITFSSSHYPPLHLDWPHAPKKVDPSNYTGPMPPKSFKPGYRSKWQFYRNFEKTYIMTEVPQ